MSKLIEDYEDFSSDMDDSDIEGLGWDDKEWLVELAVFLFILIGSIVMVLSRFLSE